MADPFHQTPIANKTPGSVIDNTVRALIKAGGHQLFGDRHADSICQPLTQGSSRGFDTGRVTVLGVARSSTVKLAKVFYVVHTQVIA